MKKIIFDINGNDNGIGSQIEASFLFLKSNPNYEITLIGNKEEILKFQEKQNFKHEKLVIIDNKIAVDKELSPRENFKINNSMNKGLDVLKENKGDAFLSSGDSASLLFSSSMKLKKIKGIDRAAFMPVIPTIHKSKKFVLLDVGANLNIKAEHLVQWAILANVFVKEILKQENPKISILNIGTEDNKGYDYHIEANKMLKERKDINYYGFIEPRYLLEGMVDVVLCDGYAGNIALKSLEGTVLSFLKLIKGSLTKTTGRKILAAGLKGAFNDIKEHLDYRNVGSAWVVGVNGIIIKTHGSSDTKSYLGALNQIKIFIESNAKEKIIDSVKI